MTTKVCVGDVQIEIEWLGKRFEVKLWTYGDGSQRLTAWDHKLGELVFEKDLATRG